MASKVISMDKGLSLFWIVVLGFTVSQNGCLVSADSDDRQSCYYYYYDSFTRSTHYIYCQFGCCDEDTVECCPDPNSNTHEVSVINTEHRSWVIALGVVAGVLVLSTVTCGVFGFYKHRMVAKKASSTQLTTLTETPVRRTTHAPSTALDATVAGSAPPSYSKVFGHGNRLPPINSNASPSGIVSPPPSYSALESTAGPATIATTNPLYQPPTPRNISVLPQ